MYVFNLHHIEYSIIVNHFRQLLPGIMANFCSNNSDGRRTSDSLNEGLPIKIARRKFQRKRSFLIKKIVGSTVELSAKVFFSLDKHIFKIMG